MSPEPSSPSPASTRVPGRVKRGTLALIAGRLWGSSCTALGLWLLAHHLGPAGFGRYTFYLALFALLDCLADFGTGAVLVQRTAPRPEELRAALVAGRRIRLVAGASGALLAGSLAFLLKEPGAGWIALASLYPLTHALGLSAVVFSNRIKLARPVLVRAMGSGLSLLGIVLGIAAGLDTAAVFLCLVAAGSTVSNIFLHWTSRRALREDTTEHSPVPLGQILRAAWPLALAALCQQAYFYVDNLFVRGFRGIEELGFYNVGVRLLSIGIALAVFAAQAALPWLAREHSADRLGAAALRLTWPLFAAASGFLGLAWPWAEELLGLFGEEYIVAASSLRWLLLAGVFVYAGAGLFTAVVATGSTRSVLFIAALGLAVNVILNALLVPSRGMEGAGLATAATEGLVAVAAWVTLYRRGAAPITHTPSGRPDLRPWLAAPLAFLAAFGMMRLLVSL